MQTILLKNIANYLGQEVAVRGWIYNFRSSGSISFLQVRDGSGFVQAIVSKNEAPAEVWEACQKITIET